MESGKECLNGNVNYWKRRKKEMDRNAKLEAMPALQRNFIKKHEQ